MVEWEKTGRTSSDIPTGKYFVAGSWNRWHFQEMKSDPDTPGVFSVDVRILGFGGEFQIVKDRDWSQALYPAPEDKEQVLGPDNLSGSHTWKLKANSGDNFKITLQRKVEGDTDTKSISIV